MDPSFLTAVFLAAPDTTEVRSALSLSCSSTAENLFEEVEMMGFLQREVSPGQHPLGCPACQKQPWSLSPAGAKQGQGPIPAGLGAG